MKKIVLFIIGVIIFNINLAGQTAQVDILINVSDGAGGSTTIHFGLDPTATDGIDQALGEQVLPPLPPAGVFDARFNLPGSTDAALKDYRQGSTSFSGQKLHEIQYQVGTGTQITIGWNLPSWVTGRLQDIVLGSIIDVAMTGTGNYIVTNPAVFNKLKLTVTYSPIAGPAVDIPINIEDGAGGNAIIHFGLDPAATEGIDQALGEQVLPPLPPAGVFDARFNLPGSTDAALKDFRQGACNFIGQIIHEIQYQVGTGTIINISWNFPTGVKGVLQDIVLGTIINVQMSGPGNYQVTNPAVFNKLKMILTYDGTLPVEITSFKAIVSSGTINLNWKTVSEINNTGFNVERSVNKSDWIKLAFVQGNQNSTSIIAYTYNDKSVSQPGSYYYRLKQFDNDGSFKYSDILEVDVYSPSVFYLSQNFPNPFNPSTTIKYQIPEAGFVTLKIYDILSKEVTTLVNENKIDGYYEINFDASKLPSGIYIYQLKAKDFVLSKKMLLLK